MQSDQIGMRAHGRDARFIIASPLGETFEARLRAIDPRIDVMELPAANPWSVAGQADMILAFMSTWKPGIGSPPPADWPGRVRWLYSLSTGVEGYPRWIYKAPLVTCGRGVAAEEIAEYAIAAILHRTKNLSGIRARGPGDWQQKPLDKASGATLGILGLGSIGMAVAHKALGLGMHLVATRRRATSREIDRIETVGSIAEVAAQSDHLLIALPLTPETERSVGAAVFAAARPGLHLINVSRGEVVDQDALLAALACGQVGFATLDVTTPEPLPTEHPLWDHPDVLLTPHTAAMSPQGLDALMAKLARDIRAFLAGDVPSDVVDPAIGY